MKTKAKPFRFKQFSIHQDNCAMKVGTDGVLLGAWVDLSDTTHILDIGTGTGLISLMMAQRLAKAKITAIEIDEQATMQAKQNFNASKWNNQLQVVHSSFQDFSSSILFDLIVSNPPYFKGISSNTPREKARNQTNLPLELLVEKASRLLKPNGRLALILPFYLLHKIKELLERNTLFLNKLTKIKGKPSAPVKRMLVEIGKRCQNPIESTLTIELAKRHQYSTEYQNLLKNYLTIF